MDRPFPLSLRASRRSEWSDFAGAMPDIAMSPRSLHPPPSVICEEKWLEVARLCNSDDMKVVLGNAVQRVGQDVRIWAADLLKMIQSMTHRHVLRKGASDYCPRT